jgi:hypothetical protein
LKGRLLDSIFVVAYKKMKGKSIQFQYKEKRFMPEHRNTTTQKTSYLKKPLQDKYNRLIRIITDAGSATLASSGGVDLANLSQNSVLTIRPVSNI